MARPQVYGLLADPLRRPHWIRDLKRVVPRVDGRDHWVMHGPLGSMVWEVEQTVARAPNTLGWCMQGAEGSGFMRFDLAEPAPGVTRITVQRFLGFRQAPAAPSLERWWGSPDLRLRGDISHLVELLRTGPGPQINAVGFRPTAAGLSRGP